MEAAFNEPSPPIVSNDVASNDHDMQVGEPAPATVAVDLNEATSLLRDSADALREGPDGGASHPSLLDASAPDVTYALRDTLERGGVTHLDLPPDLQAGPDAIPSVLNAAASALKARGLPSPDLDLYRSSMSEATATGEDFHDVLNANLSREPLAMRTDLLDAPTLQLAVADEQTLPLINVDGPVEAAQDMDAVYDSQVLENVGGTNFCEMDTLDQFQHFIRWQDVERGVHDDFVTEQVAGSWEALPQEVRDYEPTAVNIFGAQTPYPGWVDDVGAHPENQRFYGGYHIATEEGHPRVELHFDAYDSLRGPLQNAAHGYEVGLLGTGIIGVVHHPEPTAPASDEGRFADWERYEDHCAGL